MTSREFYIAWQRELKSSWIFRTGTKFFAIYSVVILIALGIIFLADASTRQTAIVALLAFLIAKFLICDFLALLVRHKRPYQLYDFKPIAFSVLFTLKSKKARSFPSAHVTSIAAISTVLFFYDVQLGIAGFILGIFAGAARVILGYHFPIDVIVGFILGVLVGLTTLYT